MLNLKFIQSTEDKIKVSVFVIHACTFKLNFDVKWHMREIVDEIICDYDKVSRLSDGM